MTYFPTPQTTPELYENIPYYYELDDPRLSNIEKDIILELKTVYDPEIPVDIYEMGLIYGITYDKNTGIVHLKLTLTAPGCPVAETMPVWVKEAVERVDGVDECEVEMVWDPPWRVDLMSMNARIELNMI